MRFYVETHPFLASYRCCDVPLSLTNSLSFRSLRRDQLASAMAHQASKLCGRWLPIAQDLVRDRRFVLPRLLSPAVCLFVCLRATPCLFLLVVRAHFPFFIAPHRITSHSGVKPSQRPISRRLNTKRQARAFSIPSFAAIKASKQAQTIKQAHHKRNTSKITHQLWVEPLNAPPDASRFTFSFFRRAPNKDQRSHTKLKHKRQNAGHDTRHQPRQE